MHIMAGAFNIPPIGNIGGWIQAFSWVITVIGGLFGVYKILDDRAKSLQQHEEELRWRRAQAGKSLNDEMLQNAGAVAALTMLDWEEREYEIQPKVQRVITRADMLRSLRVVEDHPSDKEKYVRDSFDNLFYLMGIFEHYIKQRLIDFGDIQQPIEYYVGKMTPYRAVMEQYLTKGGFKLATALLCRFESWQTAGASVSP